jgi:hypothetical protein
MPRVKVVRPNLHHEFAVNLRHVQQLLCFDDVDAASGMQVVAPSDIDEALDCAANVPVVQVVVEHHGGTWVCENVAIALLDRVAREWPVGLRRASVMILH